jgi:hypothetical protein
MPVNVALGGLARHKTGPDGVIGDDECDTRCQKPSLVILARAIP